MSKKQISPFGCKDCVHGWVDRCGLTGHKMQWHVNARHHCQHFQRERRDENRDNDLHPVASPARHSDGRLDTATR